MLNLFWHLENLIGTIRPGPPPGFYLLSLLTTTWRGKAIETNLFQYFILHNKIKCPINPWDKTSFFLLPKKTILC